MKLKSNFNVQLRVIGALLLREVITRFGRHNIGFLWLFGEPGLFTVCVTLLWMSTRAGLTSQLSIPTFILTGYSSILLWRNCVSRCINAVEPNRSLLLHRQVKVIDFFYARILLEIAGATVSLFTLTIIFSIFEFGGMTWPADLLKVCEAWLLLSWFSCSLSLILGGAAQVTEVVDRIWHIIAYVMLPFSGTFYMVDWLPDSLQSFALMIPLVHGVEMLRSGYFGASAATHYDVSYLVTACLVMTLVGLSMVKVISRRIELA